MKPASLARAVTRARAAGVMMTIAVVGLLSAAGTALAMPALMAMTVPILRYFDGRGLACLKWGWRAAGVIGVAMMIPLSWLVASDPSLMVIHALTLTLDAVPLAVCIAMSHHIKERIRDGMV